MKTPKRVQFILESGLSQEELYLRRFKKLIIAIKENDYNLFSEWLEDTELHITLAEFRNNTHKLMQLALQIAIIDNRASAIEYAVEHGANVNAALYNETYFPVERALAGGKNKSIQCLVALKANLNDTHNAQLGSPIMIALKRNDYISMRLLVRNGAIPQPEALHYAVQNRQYTIVRFFLKQKVAVNNMNAAGHTPLMLAAQTGYYEMVLLLLAGEADPSITFLDRYIAADFVPNTPDGYRIQRLLHACAASWASSNFDVVPGYLAQYNHWTKTHIALLENTQQRRLALDFIEDDDTDEDEELDAFGKLYFHCITS